MPSLPIKFLSSLGKSWKFVMIAKQLKDFQKLLAFYVLKDAKSELRMAIFNFGPCSLFLLDLRRPSRF